MYFTNDGFSAGKKICSKPCKSLCESAQSRSLSCPFWMILLYHTFSRLSSHLCPIPRFSSKHKSQCSISRKRKIPPVPWLLLSPQRPFAFAGSPVALLRCPANVLFGFAVHCTLRNAATEAPTIDGPGGSKGNGVSRGSARRPLGRILCFLSWRNKKGRPPAGNHTHPACLCRTSNQRSPRSPSRLLWLLSCSVQESNTSLVPSIGG